MEDFAPAILAGIVTGTLARLYLLRVDFRQYPSYPQGYATHLFLGFIAATLGGVAIPALVTKNFQAVTFLALAAQQFREIRDMERQSLGELEEIELVERGKAYIEGIAKVFEARNYLALVTALVASGLVILSAQGGVGTGLQLGIGFLGGGITVALLERVMAGERVGAYARVRPAVLRFEGPDLYVEDIFIMNVGRNEARQVILEHGLGAILDPIDANARATLASPGQRQAIVHDLSAVLGIRRDMDEAEFVPLAKVHHETGRIGVVILPMARNPQAMVEAIRRVPVIESAKRRPLAARAGRLARERGE